MLNTVHGSKTFFLKVNEAIIILLTLKFDILSETKIKNIPIFKLIKKIDD